VFAKQQDACWSHVLGVHHLSEASCTLQVMGAEPKNAPMHAGNGPYSHRHASAETRWQLSDMVCVSLILFRDVEFLACAQGDASSVLRQDALAGRLLAMLLVVMLTSRLAISGGFWSPARGFPWRRRVGTMRDARDVAGD